MCVNVCVGGLSVRAKMSERGCVRVRERVGGWEGGRVGPERACARRTASTTRSTCTAGEECPARILAARARPGRDAGHVQGASLAPHWRALASFRAITGAGPHH
jgi:hypothetical protein